MLLIIAWRNLWRHRTRSLAIIASVVLGVWAGAFIVSLYYGMGNERVRLPRQVMQGTAREEALATIRAALASRPA